MAILGARKWPYPRLARTIQRTWASVDVPGVQTLFYYGDATRVRLQGRDVFLPVDDGLDAAGRKTLEFFEFALEHVEFDLLFRTNLSSYVDLPNLQKFAELHAKPTRYYAGFPGRHDEILFASGAGYFLSRDLVQLALAESNNWNHALADDVALAALLQQHILPIPLPRPDYRSVADARTGDTSLFHFRCKTFSRFRPGDVRIMLALHRTFLRSRGQRASVTLLTHQVIGVAFEHAIRFGASVRRRIRARRAA